MQQDNKIHFVITGGTIDSYWDAKQDMVVVGEHSVIPETILDMKLNVPTQFTEICMKDSRAITKNDLKNMLRIIETSDASKIIITHGRFTMPDTAKYLVEHLKRKDQTIVLVGSFTPLKGFEVSDARFNLGYAIGKVQELPKGVYIEINGRTYTSNEVETTLSEGKFYTLINEETNGKENPTVK